MNPGMYGMASGQPGAARKLAGSVYGGTTNPAANGFINAGTSVATSNGLSPLTPTLSASVRTRLVSVSGRGAVRAVGFNTSGVSATATFELWIDGVRVKSLSGLMASGHGLLLVGSGSSNGTYPSGIIPDFIPFDSSCEVFITSDTSLSGGSAIYSHWIDLHQ